MTPAGREALALWLVVAVACSVGLGLQVAAWSIIGPWWLMGGSAFVVMVGVQLWRAAARPFPPPGDP